MMKSVKDKALYQVKAKVSHAARNQVSREVLDQVWDRVYDPASNQVSSRFRGLILTQLNQELK
jgi:hypothetical protein